MSTGLRMDACAGRHCASRRAKRARQLRQLEAVRLAGVGAQDRGAAGVGDDAHPSPGAAAAASRAALRGRTARRQRVRSDDAGLLEQRLDARIRTPPPRRRCATRRRDRPRPSGRPAARRSACGGPAGARSARSCAGCRTTPGTAAPRRSTRPPPSTRARRSRRCRAGCRSRRTTTGRARARPPARSGRARHRRSATAAQRAPGGARGARRSRRAGLRVPITPRQFGPDQPHPGRRGRSQAARPAGQRPSGPVSANPADQYEQRPHAAQRAVAGDGRARRRRHGDHGQLRCLGQVVPRRCRRAGHGACAACGLTG